jgi:hypothetical protein
MPPSVKLKLCQLLLAGSYLIALFAGHAVVAFGQSSETQIKYLSGTGKDDAVLWDFYCTSGRKSGVWTKIPVPSCWEQQGFGGYNYGRNRISDTNPLANEQGKYRLSFSIPADWKGRVVRLVFDGSMTDTEVWVNGQSAGPIHQGAFYRFKYDITKLLKFGEPNLLEVTVSKVSANDSVNRAERSGVDYWVFGGIFRPVYLEALPKQFIDWTAIDARADGSFALEAHLVDLNATGKLSAQILDAQGKPVGSPFATDLSPQQAVVKLQTSITKPALWTAETPNLYRVRVTLSTGSQPQHTVIERFGFRTFEVRAGDGLYLNGQKIILKGANRHSFWPESGRTLSRKISYDDVRLIKELNMNAVRMSHYPPDAHFLDACDELGLYVLDELGGWQRSYDAPTGRRLIGEIIRRDVNHPAILFWDNGNEGGWNREVDDEFAKWDPQKRVVLHPWENFNHLNTAHYRKYPEAEKILNGSDLYLPTEFMHGLYDGGAGAGLWDYWQLMSRNKLGAGGFIWALVDECVARTDQNGKLDCAGNQGPDGIVGPYREKEGSFNTIREIWSPVQVTGPKNLTPESTVVFQIQNNYDFTDLSECSFVWQLARFPTPDQLNAGHTVLASGMVRGPRVAPHSTGELPLRLPVARSSDVLYLTAKDPSGRELWTWSWSVPRLAKTSRPERDSRSSTLQTGDDGTLLTISNNLIRLRFAKKSGELVEVTHRGRIIPLGRGPRLVAFRRNDRKYDDVSGDRSLTNFDTHMQGRDVLVDVNYRRGLQAHWRISAEAELTLNYEYQFDGLVDVLGINFEVPEAAMKAIRWQGMGPYRVWQNRLNGTRLDVWQNTYNDATPGENWSYPEFKGYFRDWRWAVLQTAAGKIIVSTDAEDSFLGLYKPADGKDGLLDLPNVGIAFLDVIPAMRNKFHTTDELGPQSQPRQVSGIRHGTIHFRFGE